MITHSPSPPTDMWLATSISAQAGSLLITTGAHRVGKASEGACDRRRNSVTSKYEKAATCAHTCVRRVSSHRPRVNRGFNPIHNNHCTVTDNSELLSHGILLFRVLNFCENKKNKIWTSRIFPLYSTGSLIFTS